MEEQPMITTTINKRNEGTTIFRRFSFLSDEVVWHFALVSVVLAALFAGVGSISGAPIV
jgi:hypothetical protein